MVQVAVIVTRSSAATGVFECSSGCMPATVLCRTTALVKTKTANATSPVCNEFVWVAFNFRSLRSRQRFVSMRALQASAKRIASNLR